MPCRRYLVSGRVQGVGFRYFTVDAASRHGVRGFTRNLSDGRVEVVADADDNRLAQFVGELRAGPPSARVSGVEVAEIPDGSADGGPFDSFTIRQTP